MCCVGDVVVWGVGGVAGWQSTVAGVETHQDWRLRAVSGYPDTREREQHLLLLLLLLTPVRISNKTSLHSLDPQSQASQAHRY